MKQLITKKPWGSFTQFTHNEKSTVKTLFVKPGEELSYQSHRKRSEFWYVLDGKPTVVISGKKKKLKVGDSVRFGPGVKHRILNETKKGVTVLEIATGNFDERDIVRYQDKYHR